MNENKKTIIFGGVALVLLILAIISSPGKITPEAFLDQGDEFFPGFDDPNEATTLEVVEYDASSGSTKPFKVTFDGSRWTIPSHHNYPADAKERLARTAAGIIDIKKDEFRSDNVSDHEACGVVDPLDQSASALGRGQRVTIKGEGGNVLADFILGNSIGGRQDFRFVRVPGQSRVYAAKVDLELSTRFEDWIDTDLLRLEKYKVGQLVLRDYSVNERTGGVDNRDNVILSKLETGWTANQLAKGQAVDSARMDRLLNSLVELSIVGVRPKPEGLSASLKVSDIEKPLTQADISSLQSKGFYLTREGQLLSNDGELQVFTGDGLAYTLRFGEVVYGSGLEVTAGVEGSSGGNKEDGENRYLFITVDFNPGYFKEPPRPGDTSFVSRPEREWSQTDWENKRRKDNHDLWSRQMAQGKQAATELSNRFADWYYVISSDSYDKIHLNRAALIVNK